MKKLNSLIQGFGLLTLIAGLVGACSIFQSAKDAPAAQAQNDSSIDRTIASEEDIIPGLTFAQIEELDSKTVYEFYKKVYELMADIEKFQNNNANGDFSSKTKNSQLFQLIEESYAQGTETLPPYKVGSNCLIGGYWGTWQRKSSAGHGAFRITCDSPNRCALPTDHGGKKSGHQCNPKFFTYANADKNEPYCADLKKDLTQSNCKMVVERFAKEMGLDTFTKHFHANLKALIRKDPKYSQLPQDRAVRQYIDEVINAEFNRVKAYCGTTDAERNRHTAGQRESCFQLLKNYKNVQMAVAKIERENPRLRRPTNAPPRVNARIGGLGPYSCLKQGLARAGYPNASNKYIAAIALAAKYNQDAFMNTPEEGRQIAMKTTIMNLASIGVCDSSQYEFSPEEAGAADAYLSQSKFSGRSEYESLFQTKIGKMTFDQWSTPTIKRRDFNFWNKGTPLQQCVVPAPQQTQAICEEMSQACGLDTVGCGLDVHEPAQPRDGRRHQQPYNGQPDDPQYDPEAPGNAERH